MNARRFCLLAAGYFFIGCLRAVPAEPAHRSPNSEIYDQQTNRFAETWLFKPGEPKTNDLCSALAPLILQQVSGSWESCGLRFGGLELSNGIPVIQGARPIVYVKADAVEVNGKTHARFTYVWFYSANFSGTNADKPSAQGVRITLDDSGRPAVWEMLADASHRRVIFVSHSLEAAALREHGPPVRGRRYSIERAPAQIPGTVVARVLEDGPVPLGPILYLRARTGSALTLICRCMPAQAKQVLGNSSYALLPAEEAPTAQVLAALHKAGRTFWSDFPGPDDDLARLLRLPHSF